MPLLLSCVLFLRPGTGLTPALPSPSSRVLSTVKIALVQTNPIIGDFAQNLQKVLDRVDTARQAGCDLVVFPELTLCGYPPQDLLGRVAFLDAHDQALAELIHHLEGITCILGVLERRSGPGKRLYNSAFVLEKDRILFRARKQQLNSCDVFDETDYFHPAETSTIFPIGDLHCGLTIGEGTWWNRQADPSNSMKDFVLGAVVPDCLINISALPYHSGKLTKRQQVFSRLCRENNLPLLYVNQVGGQDGLVFDGHSMLIDAFGQTRAVARGFGEDMLIVDSEDWHRSGPAQPVEDSIGHVREALVLGVRDYLHKSGFTKAILGLSGGIDSALTAVIACQALGSDKVLCVAMPSPFTSQASVDDARQLAANLGCEFAVIGISEAMAIYRDTLAPFFGGLAEDIAEQNIQARIRGNLLMALSNKFDRLLLSTGNKSEMAVGYCTLYGDMSGGLAVLADVPKTMVYQIAEVINAEREIIPRRSIDRPPTAELKPGQLDQDDLPPYEVLDAVLHAYLEEGNDIAEIAAQGVDEEVVRDIVRRMQRNEYKRKQAPLGIKVTTEAFGPGRRYPLVHAFRE